jgi:hypothetical protein
MLPAESEASGKSHAPDAFPPGPDAEKTVDLGIVARRKKEKLPSPSERLEDEGR